MIESMRNFGAKVQLVAYGVSDTWIHVSPSYAVPYNAERGDILNPLEGRVPTKYQWRSEIADKIKTFSDVKPYDCSIPTYLPTYIPFSPAGR